MSLHAGQEKNFIVGRNNYRKSDSGKGSRRPEPHLMSVVCGVWGARFDLFGVCGVQSLTVICGLWGTRFDCYLCFLCYKV